MMRTMSFQTVPFPLLLVVLALLVVVAQGFTTSIPSRYTSCRTNGLPQKSSHAHLPTTNKNRNAVVLFASMGGPLAQAKKLTDPKGYERVVQTKMKQDGVTREQAEDDYNQFLENPPFYYALDKKEEYYKSLGYKDMFEGMIGEAEKEGRGDEVRERIAKFRQQSILKAAGVLITFVVTFLLARAEYWKDPDTFLPGI